MTTEFNIGDKVWYGYPEPTKGKITKIEITASGVWYIINHKSAWENVGKSRIEAALKGLKSDLKSHERYIAQLKQEIAELEKAMGEA